MQEKRFPKGQQFLYKRFDLLRIFIQVDQKILSPPQSGNHVIGPADICDGGIKLSLSRLQKGVGILLH